MGAVVICLGLAAMGWSASSQDEAILLVLPERIAQGQLPYRDFSSSYGPGGFWLLAGVYSLTGPSVLAARCVGVLVHVAVAVSVVRLTARHGQLASLLCGLMSALLLFPLGNAPYAWLVSTALASWAAVLLSRPVLAQRPLLAGLCCGLALSWRPDALLLAVAPALVLIRGGAVRRRWLLGAGVGLVPLAVHFAAAPRRFVQDLVLGRALTAGQSRLRLPPQDQVELRLLLLLALALVLTVTAAIATRQRPQVAAALLAVLVLPQALQRADQHHLLYGLALAVPLGAAALLDLAARGRRLARPAVSLGSATALLAVLAVTAPVVLGPLILLASGAQQSAVVVEHDSRELVVSPTHAAALRRLIADVDARTSPGQQLLVFPADTVRPVFNDVGVYHLFPRLAQRSRHVDVNPGVTNQASSGLVEDVLRADVVILVDTGQRSLLPYGRSGSTMARDAIRQHFCPEAVIDYYAVLVRCR